jgi:hypothetical protein
MTPFEHAAYLVRKLGVFGAREFAARMPGTERWADVRAVLDVDVNSRQSRVANLRHLDCLIRGTARRGNDA